MAETRKMIESQLSKYLTGEISKEILYQWVLGTLHKMLEGDIFLSENLEVWGIITKLAEIEDMDTACCDKFVADFIRILSGDKSASFSFAMKIPTKFAKNNLSEIKRVLKNYSAQKCLSQSEIQLLESAVKGRICAFGTIHEILEDQILNLLKLGYDSCDNDGRIKFDLKHTLFISEAESLSLENDFLKKIIALLECYEGEKCFYVYVNFSNGFGKISIQV